MRDAGFTYTLHSATGIGCDGGPARNFTGTPDPIFAGAYGCAQLDVTTNNRSDVYWAMFYVSNGRQSESLMTSPIVSDVGLSLIVRAEEATFVDTATLLFTPFTPGMWMLSFVTVIFVSITLWVSEHAEVQSESEGGFLTVQAVKSTAMSSFYTSASTLLGMDVMKAASWEAGLLNLFWCLFAVCWVAAYTANLAQILIQPTFAIPIDSIDAVIKSPKGNPVCARHGTGYIKFLYESFPKMEIVEVLADDPDIPGTDSPPYWTSAEKKMREGKCIGFIDALPHLELMQAHERFAGAGLKIPGQPLNWGVMDMAIGVREDLPHVRDALSYSLSALRECSETTTGSVCFRGKNMAGLWEASKGEAVSQVQEDQLKSLGPENFFIPIIAIASVGFLMIFSVCFRPELRERRRAMFTDDLLTLLQRGTFDAYWEEGQLKLDEFVREFKSEPSFRNSLRKSFLKELLLTNVKAWRKANELFMQDDAFNNVTHASQPREERAKFEKTHADCIDTLTNMLERALKTMLEREDIRIVTVHAKKRSNVSSPSFRGVARVVAAGSMATTAEKHKRNTSRVTPGDEPSEQQSPSMPIPEQKVGDGAQPRTTIVEMSS